MVDPCAAILVFIVTGLLCVGIKEVCLIFMCELYFCFTLKNPFVYIFSGINKILKFSEHIGSNHCYGSECLCNGFHHNSWWIPRFQDWMGWIWTSKRVMDGSYFYLFLYSFRDLADLFLDLIDISHLEQMACLLGLRLSSFHTLVLTQSPALLRRYEFQIIDQFYGNENRVKQQPPILIFK